MRSVGKIPTGRVVSRIKPIMGHPVHLDRDRQWDALDDQGSQYDANGKLRNWWSKEDLMNFRERSIGLIAQYDHYSPLPNLFVNGQNTLSENIADLTGIIMAYAALQRTHSCSYIYGVVCADGDLVVALGYAVAVPGRSYVPCTRLYRGDLPPDNDHRIIFGLSGTFGQRTIQSAGGGFGQRRVIGNDSQAYRQVGYNAR